MYSWALTLAIIAVIAAILGFGGIAQGFASVATIIFVIALIGTVVFLFLGWKAAKTIAR